MGARFVLRHWLQRPPADAARLLFVDDVPELRRAFCRTLRAFGHVVVEAEGGRAALDAIESQLFDVVLSDVMMPEMNGIELLHVLRRREPFLPVVLMSAAPLREIEQQALAAGAFAYLAKPVEGAELAALVARALGTRRRALAAAEAFGRASTSGRWHA